MQLSPVHKERLKTAYDQGFQQGIQQVIMREREYSIACILRIRFGEIDPQLSAIIPPLLALSAAEYIPIVLKLSREVFR